MNELAMNFAGREEKRKGEQNRMEGNGIDGTLPLNN